MKKKTSRDKAKLIARCALEKKGENIVLMDMRKISTVYDWFVLISTGSARRIKTISNTIQEKLSKEKINPLHIEGISDSGWVLLDYDDVIVHVFYGKVREFYGLERLWSDARLEPFNDTCLRKKSQRK